MKKITYYTLMVMTLCGMTMASCSDDEWQPGPEQTDGVQAYIYTDATSYTYLPADEQSFTLHVVRRNTTEAATIHLTAEGEDFVVPATVAFNAGEGEKEVPISFDIAIGTESSVTISIAEGEGYIYGSPMVTVSVARDYTWQSLGTWTLTSSFYGAEGTTDVYKAQEANIYKAVAPYEEGYDLLFNVDGSNVTVEGQPVVSSYGDYGVLSVEGTGTITGNTINVTLLFYVSAGYFGEFNEVFSGD